MSFNCAQIMSALARSGLWPVSHQTLLSIPRPKNSDRGCSLIDADEMYILLLSKKPPRG